MTRRRIGYADRAPFGPEDTERIAELVSEAVEHGLAGAFSELGGRIREVVAEVVSFAPVAVACRHKRGWRRLDVIARKMRRPQQALFDLESCRMGMFDLDLVERYVAFLGLDGWFQEWCHEHPGVVLSLMNPATADEDPSHDRGPAV